MDQEVYDYAVKLREQGVVFEDAVERIMSRFPLDAPLVREKRFSDPADEKEMVPISISIINVANEIGSSPLAIKRDLDSILNKLSRIQFESDAEDRYVVESFSWTSDGRMRIVMDDGEQLAFVGWFSCWHAEDFGWVSRPMTRRLQRCYEYQLSLLPKRERDWINDQHNG